MLDFWSFGFFKVSSVFLKFRSIFQVLFKFIFVKYSFLEQLPLDFCSLVAASVSRHQRLSSLSQSLQVDTSSSSPAVGGLVWSLH